MKRLLLMGVIVGVVAAGANAASLGMRWAGTADQKIFAAPSDTVAVDIVLTIYGTAPAQEGVSTVIYRNLPVVDDNLIQVGLTADPLGDLAAAGFSWSAGGGGGPLGDPAQQVALAANIGGSAVAPGEYVIGRQFLHLADDSPIGGLNKEIFFNHAFGVDVLNAAGANMTFDNRYNTTYYAVGGPGYVAYNYFGNPGWVGPKGSGIDGQPTPNPLLLGKIPEPTSLGLFALGGLALARRRR